MTFLHPLIRNSMRSGQQERCIGPSLQRLPTQWFQRPQRKVVRDSEKHQKEQRGSEPGEIGETEWCILELRWMDRFEKYIQMCPRRWTVKPIEVCRIARTPVQTPISRRMSKLTGFGRCRRTFQGPSHNDTATIASPANHERCDFPRKRGYSYIGACTHASSSCFSCCFRQMPHAPK